MDRLRILPLSDRQPYADLVAEHGSPLALLNLSELIAQYRALSQALPGVRLYFAVKALPLAPAVRQLSELGLGFDIATQGEIDLLRGESVRGEDCIHTHPIKTDADIRKSLDFGCTTFVVDNPDEMAKFAAYADRVRLLIRVSFPNPGTPIDLSKKFGCQPEALFDLLALAQQLSIEVLGVSFHAGSQCPDASNHVQAIQQCARLMAEWKALGNAALRVLDIGGGFPVETVAPMPDIETFCAPIRAALSKLSEEIEVIAEPGRFLCATSVTSVATVIGKAQRQDRIWYYLDDGIYGIYSCIIFDHNTYPQLVFSDTAELHPAALVGPTCDSIDVIDDDMMLPALAIGDLVIGLRMGAYCIATSTEFNSIPKAKVVVIAANAPSTVLCLNQALFW